MPTTQGMLSLFVLLLSYTNALQEGKKFCSSKCRYDPFVVFGICNGVDLQLDPTIFARSLSSGCASCDNIDLKDLGINNGHEIVNNGFPACLPASIDILRLSDLHISWLVGSFFATLPRLRYLYVINGTVDSIEPGTFTNISRLNTLVISGNKLSRLACGWFNGLHFLKNLGLTDNRLTLIEAGALQNLTALRALVLAQNLLNRLEREYFEGLSAVELIDLNHNNIEAIEPGTFKPCPILMALFLSGNRLSVLSEGWSVGLGNLLVIFSMSDNTFRCMCSSAWIPEYLSVLSAIPGETGDAVCQFPLERKGEAISETLLQRLPPCLHPKVAVSAQNGGQTFTCDVYWEEEPYISWQLPGSLVLTVHVPGRYARTSGASSLTHPANITAHVEHNVSLEGWAFPCAVPNVNESVNSTACGNFFGKTTSLLVIGQSQAVRWNYQAVHCVASFSQGSAMNNVTASAVISVEESLVEEVTTKNGQDTSRTTDMTPTTTMVLSFLLGESTPDNNKEVYIWISVACAAALVGLWGYLLVAKLWCDHTDDSTKPGHSKEESTDVSDHEYATINDEDDSDVLREHQYEEIRDDVTSSAYIPHDQRSSVHLENNRESRKPNPFYTFNICERRVRGLYTISENDTAAEEPSEDDDVLGIAEGPSSDGSGGDGGMSGSAEGTSRDGDATDTGMSGSAEGLSEAAGMSGRAEGTSRDGDDTDTGMSGSAEGLSEAAGMSGRAEGTSRDGDATDTGMSGSAEGLSEAADISGRAEGTSRDGDDTDTGPSGDGVVEDGDKPRSTEMPSRDSSDEDAGMSSDKDTGMSSTKDTGMSSVEDAGMSSAEGAGMSSAENAGMPSAEGAGMSSTEDAGMSCAEDDGISSAEGAGMSSAEGAGMSSAEGAGMSCAEDAGMSNAEGAGTSSAEDAVIMVVTVVGCLLTIVAIWVRPDLRKLANVPLVSISCADILFVIFGPAFWIEHFLQPQWKPPGALCSFLGYIIPVLWGVSLGHMCCIALQRYFLICTNSECLKSNSVLIIMLLLTWLNPIVSFLPLYLPEEVKVDPKIKRCSVAGSTNISAKILVYITVFIIPYVVAITCYGLIHKHVRKSTKRVKSHALRQSKGFTVRFTRGKGGNSSRSPTMTASVRVTNSTGDPHGGAWLGDDNSSSSNEEGRKTDQNEPTESKRSKITTVSDDQTDTSKNQDHVGQNPSIYDNEQNGDDHNGQCETNDTSLVSAETDQTDRSENQQDQDLSSDDEELKENIRIMPDTVQVSDISNNSGTNEQKYHVSLSKSSQNSAAERQITKMMLTLFLVYSVCCMPMTIMAMVSSKVSSEAFIVGQVLMALNGALNPIVYGLMNTRIREGYKYILDGILNFIN
uniref:G-protein coupled receptors family 1 profile domain-containing protein n=1 Tax=Branchiostoma floridae TaxID=7739 RepID=C3ZAC1_BRAFL|eukprot:XP_002594503.1 hypothetical protein BRAFLDRAFT_87695 [Branchiostoma floridae]